MFEPSTPPAPEVPRSPHALVRHLQDRKPILRDRALTVLATLLVLLISLAGWRYYSQWRLGRIILTNQGIPLLAQLIPETGDEPMGEPFDLVARSTLSLPSGDYRVRVNGVGRLGQTYRFAVNQGETITHEVSLDDGRLLTVGGDPPRVGVKPNLPATSRCPLRR